MTTIRTDHPVARKKHACEICGCAIEPGTRYFHQVNDYDGFCDFKAHEECVDYEMSNREPYDDDGCGPDQTACYLLDDLEDILGSREAASNFYHEHSMYECVKFVQEHGNS